MTELTEYVILLALWIAIICLVYHNTRLMLIIKRKNNNIEFWRGVAEGYEAKLDEVYWGVNTDDKA